MIQWYCEDGDDNWIEIFDTKREAKAYAEENKKVLEIHKYNYVFKKGSHELEDIEHLGCVWMRPGWNGFMFEDENPEDNPEYGRCLTCRYYGNGNVCSDCIEGSEYEYRK